MQEQLRQGQHYEDHQDKLWSRWYDIVPATRSEDRSGIDRHFSHKHSPLGFTVQYKADMAAGHTGNLFFETVSVDEVHKPGWALQCSADFISTYVPADNVAYLLSVHLLGIWMPAWVTQHQSKTIPNDGYNTVGIVVPRKKVRDSPVCVCVADEKAIGVQYGMFD